MVCWVMEMEDLITMYVMLHMCDALFIWLVRHTFPYFFRDNVRDNTSEYIWRERLHDEIYKLGVWNIQES